MMGTASRCIWANAEFAFVWISRLAYVFYLQILLQNCYARAPHCPQNGPWTRAPQALQKLRGGAGGGISSAGGADWTGLACGAPLSGPDSTVPSDAQAVAAADDVSDTTVPNTWTSTIEGGAAAALART